MGPFEPAVASGAFPGTDPAIVTGLPAQSAPVVMSSACRRCTNVPFSFVRATRYNLRAIGSITGVPAIPTLLTMLRSFRPTISVIGTAVTDGGFVKSRTHNGEDDAL